MKYLLLAYGTEEGWTDEEREACMQESLALCNDLRAQGKLMAASPLQSVATATSVRVRGGKAQITDGPFAETVEQLGGFLLIDVEHLDEALAVANRFPPARKGTVEVRPLHPLDGLD